MKLASLGYTPQAVAFLQGAMRLGHEIVAAYEAGNHKEAVRAAAPQARFRDDWESLLGEREVDAVLIAGPTLAEDVPSNERERRDDQLRKLIQAGVPLIVIPPVCEAIVGFELEMIRKDVRSIVITAAAAPLHTALDDLTQWLTEKSAAAIGKIEVLALERYLPLRQRSDVLAAFAYDALLLRRLAGPLLRLTASGAAREAEKKPSLASVVVHADAESTFPVRWSVAPVTDFAGARLIAQGATDRVTLDMPSGEASWRLQAPGIDRSYEPLDSVATVLDELENALAFRSIPQVSWLDACRAVEAMEAIDRSLSRGRTVDLDNEEHSEESSFKGIMAAGGCLLLLGTLGALICAGVLTVAFRPEQGTGSAYWGWLQACLIVPLVVFLFAQLLSLGLSRHLRTKRGPTSGDDSVTPS